MNKSKLILSGIRLMLQGTVAFSLMALCVKLASQSLPSLEIVFFRSLFGILMISWYIRKKKVSFFGKERKLLFFRGLSGFIALALFFYTFSKLPLGTAVILNYTSPIFVAIFAMLFLGERPGLRLVVLIGIAFLGICLLVEFQVTDAHFEVFLGLLSAIFAATSYVLIRAIKHKESPLTVIFYFMSISTFGSLFFIPFGFVWPTFGGWLTLIGVGIGAFFGQLWMTISLRRMDASLATPFSYLAPLLAFIYGFIFFGESLSLRSLTGVFLIILSGSLISFLSARRRVNIRKL